MQSIKKQFKNNAKLPFACMQVYVQEKCTKNVPSWTEPQRNAQNEYMGHVTESKFFLFAAQQANEFERRVVEARNRL